MTKYEELEKKGDELVEQRNKATGAERAMLNKEITAIRAAQIAALKEEILQALELAVPEMVKQAIQSSDVMKQIEALQRGE
ncbi:hypothetical protein [Escherichia coli]|uniref:hypothetical protein n=1 Tax=Escherichia coli TaxID=562 RepID=UPI001D3B1262|nr:hypothetical protein [Escherichia coli]MBZ8421597.1 hypothetical protein [Escherichia coli]MBZ8430990.1 hypothetical protein [Escherichia coli]MCQ6211175.1 hypothetical protein [Escherichia coli]MCQ6215890.1 hypothetical protein [Escherichia coli]MCZ0520475.1 hypothetical protein [Escherichia coli]